MTDCKDFFEVAKRHLAWVKETQKDQIVKAASLLGECMQNDGIVQLVGFGNDGEFSMELGYRAGGLMPFHRCDIKDLCLRGLITEEQYNDPTTIEKEEYAPKFWETYKIDPRDMFIITCTDASEGLCVEIAKKAKEEGHKVIAVISKKAADAATSRHSSGKKTTDFADLVLDEGADYPDTNVEVAPGIKMCQVGTIAGNVIAQMLTGEAYRYFVEKGEDCPILFSANIAGADVHNRAISDKYLGRWNS